MELRIDGLGRFSENESWTTLFREGDSEYLIIHQPNGWKRRMLITLDDANKSHRGDEIPADRLKRDED